MKETSMMNRYKKENIRIDGMDSKEKVNKSINQSN